MSILLKSRSNFHDFGDLYADLPFIVFAIYIYEMSILHDDYFSGDVS